MKQVNSDALNHHKAMAMGKADSGSVQKIPAAKQNQKTAMGGELADGARGIGGNVGKGRYGQQGAPDHGDLGGDHHRRGPKL